jgi:transcriptional regulator
MDEARRQFVLQLMQPMIREFHMTVIEMRERGQTETEIAAMLDKIEVENRGKVEDWILDAIMSELRLAARH